mgnify:CR=1 FL=1
MRYVSALLVICFVFSCSTKRPQGKTEAEVLYKEAQELMEDGRYMLATERLNNLRSKHPYSFYATPAELLQADILFEQENYVEAAASYVLFKDFHPKHKKITYVVWRIAESFYNQLPSTYDRDLSSASEAISYYRELLRVHPQSEYASKAKKRIKKCEEMLREKEKYIADFYFKTDEYGAARFRYRKILENFENTELKKHAMLRILRATAQLDEKKACENYYRAFQGSFPSESLKELDSAYQNCRQGKTASGGWFDW